MNRCQKIGLSFNYGWSNPDIGDDALVSNVLSRGIFHDICLIVKNFGIQFVRDVWREMPADPVRDVLLTRALRNIESVLNEK